MNEKTPDQLLAAIVGILFRHKRRVACVFMVCLLAALAALLWLPRSYTSEAKLFVRVGRESVTLDPTATTGQTVLFQKSQEVEVNSVLEVLSGRRISELVVDELGVDYVMERDLPQNPITSLVETGLSGLGVLVDRLSGNASDAAATASDTGIELPTKQKELAIHKLEQKTVCYAPKDSTVITIAAKAGSPRTAQKIAQTVVDVFLKEHVRINRTAGSFDFFVTQTERLGDLLRAAEQKLETKKNLHNILTIEGKREALQQELRDVELALLQTDRDLAFARVKIQDLQSVAHATDKTTVTEEVDGFANEARDHMREQLYKLEIKERDLRQVYADSNPIITAIQAQRQELAQILNSEPVKRQQQKTGLNPNWQALELDLKRQQVETNAIAARKAMLAEQLTALNSKLRDLNGWEVELADLQRQVQLADANYRLHADKLEQARIDAALGSRNISNISVVQPANIVLKAAFPKKRITMMAGIVFGAFAAVAVALLSEFFDSTIRTREQVESDLGLPVLLTVPAQESQAQRDRGLKRFAMAGDSHRHD